MTTPEPAPVAGVSAFRDGDSARAMQALPKGRRPTMRDVAALAGVSLSTVSRVVNGSPPVAPELALKVQRAVEIVGYRHNHTAGTLRRADGVSRTIGLIFEDVSNPFFSAIHRGVEEVARARGVVTFAGSSDEDPDRERELIEALLARRVDGLILAPTATEHTHLLRDVACRARPRLRRPPANVDRCRLRAQRQPPRRRASRRPPDRTRPPAHRLPRRPARRFTPPPNASPAIAPHSPRRASLTSPTSSATPATEPPTPTT